MTTQSNQMGWKRLTLVAGLCCMISAPAMAWIDYTFDTSVGDWDFAGNWVPGTGPPGAGDTATILVGQECNIPTDYDAKIDILEIQKVSGTSYGEVFICAGGSLTIHKNCPDLDGILWFWKGETEEDPPGELIIDGDLTITGHHSASDNFPAYIDSENRSTTSGIIKGADANAKLTLVGSPDHEDLRLVGRIEVEVELVNDAQVGPTPGSANAGARTLTLSTNAKSGDGLWHASRGTLLIEDGCSVSGAGRWEMNDGVSPYEPVIQFDEAALSLTGDFEILVGTLDVNDSIKTEGRLDFKDEFDTDTTIVVAANESAEFGVNSSCP